MVRRGPHMFGSGTTSKAGDPGTFVFFIRIGSALTRVHLGEGRGKIETVMLQLYSLYSIRCMRAREAGGLNALDPLCDSKFGSTLPRPCGCGCELRSTIYVSLLGLVNDQQAPSLALAV
ncbi:hypothetical protein CBOM_08025 [Ceraceosorus bombacis]|uniref:Uncharacterized protein n=1 Tax=Ceraceosorus bombacis TaxID=401625 RepID=A0A0P1BQR5_9BASI|nr:hypothetical protein CBOM_08025 [Ceraceosorus bombacis]